MKTLSSLESRFYNSGYYASLGMARGINAGAPSAISAARTLANRVANTINSALKIHSPSDVTWDSGEYVSEGLAGGMLDKIRIVKNAASRIAEAAVPTGHISRSVALAGAYAADMSYSYAGDVETTHVIIVPLEIDGREFARATATYTQEELNNREKLNRYIRGYR